MRLTRNTPSETIRAQSGETLNHAQREAASRQRRDAVARWVSEGGSVLLSDG